MVDLDDINKNNKEVGKTIATKVPVNIHAELMELIENGAYLSISDFLRESIREQLKTYKISNIRNINYSDAKREVLSYFIKYSECYFDEIALDLELDFELVYNIINDLLRDKQIELIYNKKTLLECIDSNREDIGFNIIKFKGKRLIVESKFKNEEFISLRENSKDNSILKNKGLVLSDGSVILSEAYRFIG